MRLLQSQVNLKTIRFAATTPVMKQIQDEWKKWGPVKISSIKYG
jgi:hypothetical protein